MRRKNNDSNCILKIGANNINYKLLIKQLIGYKVEISTKYNVALTFINLLFFLFLRICTQNNSKSRRTFCIVFF